MGHRAGDGAQMAWIELVELGAQLTAKPKGKGKELPAPKERPVPAERPAKKEEVRAEPEPEKKPTKSKQKPDKPEEKKPGFVDGLRKFFKRRDNP